MSVASNATARYPVYNMVDLRDRKVYREHESMRRRGAAQIREVGRCSMSDHYGGDSA